MSFLLDTNVVSELVRPRPNPGLIEWLAGRDEDQIFLSVVTLAELRYGIARLPVGRRRRSLAQGRPIEAMDGLVAATARVHGLELASRNVRDFEGASISIHNPWTAAE